VRSFDDLKGAALAVAREDERREGAEIIDLVHLPVGARPQPRAELDYEEVEDARLMHCASYNDCLAFAASVRWQGFHCRRCPRFNDCEVAVAPKTANGGAMAAVIRLRR